MWAHVIVGFLLFPISILIMKRFSVGLEFSEYDISRNNALMITKIPRKACHKDDDITNYFKVIIKVSNLWPLIKVLYNFVPFCIQSSKCFF